MYVCYGLSELSTWQYINTVVIQDNLLAAILLLAGCRTSVTSTALEPITEHLALMTTNNKVNSIIAFDTQLEITLPAMLYMYIEVPGIFTFCEKWTASIVSL